MVLRDLRSGHLQQGFGERGGDPEVRGGEIEIDLSWLVEKLTSRYRVHAVILFGSRARGDWLPHSDYDLPVVADFSKLFLDRIYELSELVEESRLHIEFHPYTVNEVMDMLKRGWCP